MYPNYPTLGYILLFSRVCALKTLKGSYKKALLLILSLLDYDFWFPRTISSIRIHFHLEQATFDFAGVGYGCGQERKRFEVQIFDLNSSYQNCYLM